MDSVFDPHKYVDGTNILAGTEYFDDGTRFADSYFPSQSNAPIGWQQRWISLRSRFERLVENYRPVRSGLVQMRIPAHARDSVGNPPRNAGGHLLLGGGGLQRLPSQLFTKSRQPLIGAFAIRSATGQPLSNSAAEPLAYRFGLFRQITIEVDAGYQHDPRPIPQPQLSELAREATGLLYQLPADVAVTVWRNWLSGFSRGQNSGEYLWFDALYELAWHSQAGSLLHAKRMAWFGNCRVELVGDGLFPRLLEHPNWSLLEKLPHESGYPMAYCSELSDVARASVAAIDEIIERDALVNNPSGLRAGTERSSGVNTTARTNVFISYSHKDKKWREALETHLKPYVSAGLVTAWSDSQIKAGSRWFSEVQSALLRTKVAILLVTPDFLASDFIAKHELTPLLKEAEKGGVRILWVRIRECAWDITALKDYKAVVSPPEKPLAEMTKPERDGALKRICQEIRSAVNP